MDLSPYLTFDGQCKAAFEFYARVFGGRIEMMLTNGKSPMADSMPPEQWDRVMHASLIIGEKVIQGADAPPQSYHKLQGFCVAYRVGTVVEAERVFSALSDGAQIQMAIQPTFWSPRFGLLVDRFGTPWMVNCQAPLSGLET